MGRATVAAFLGVGATETAASTAGGVMGSGPATLIEGIGNVLGGGASTADAPSCKPK